MSLNLFSLFIPRGQSFRDLPLGVTKTQTPKAQTPKTSTTKTQTPGNK